MSRTVFASLLIALGFIAIAQGAPNRLLPPIQEIKGISAKNDVFAVSGHNRPLVFRSAADAGKYLTEEGLATLKEKVDFKQQVVLLFAWRGSGQDRINTAVLESFPEQVVFSYRRGLTKDLRQHVRVYALRSNVKWRVAGAIAVKPRPGSKPVQNVSGEYIKVEVKGKLNSRVFAIGGETTGVIISANGVRWELDLGRNAELRKKANDLNGKTVVVKGILNVKRGVEIRQRWIVAVSSLEAAGAGKGDAGRPAKGAYLNEKGQLRSPLVLRDAQSGFAGVSGHIWTIDPDGKWRHQTFLNRTIRDPDQTGQFNQQQLQSLAGYLAKYDLLGLPQRMGKNPGVNPHEYSIMFGKKRTVMIGRGGAELPPADLKSVDAPQQRFALIMRWLLQQMKGDPRPE